MQKYIMHRALAKTERREIEAKNWDDAVKQLEKFEGEPVPDDCVLMSSYSNVEFIGNT